MTLDEAIKHCLEVADSKEREAEFETDYACYFMTDKEREECKECAAEHRQLAEWLTELKQWRRVYGVCPSYEMCIPECKEGYNAQIAEYKRILKAAVEDYPDLTDMWRYADKVIKLIGGDESDT